MHKNGKVALRMALKLNSYFQAISTSSSADKERHNIYEVLSKNTPKLYISVRLSNL